MAVFLCVVLLSCQPAELRPAKKPAAVPDDAVWAGGADGGAYMRCSVDAAHNVDRCTVWNDFTGETSGPADYRLSKHHRAATASELKFTGAVNNDIYLQNGLILERQ